ncbi:MAG TPA: hypothetical protein VFU47_16150 [Armatimonadota bacterium]|nr:hypothetical protein [Armatimonadota bacterium]
MADEKRAAPEREPGARWDQQEDIDATGPGAGLPAGDPIWVGGAIDGDAETTGSVITHEHHAPFRAQFPDDRNVTTDPIHEGTIYQNTDAGGHFLVEEDEPEDITQDLGPEGAVVQEVGGEARY